MDQNTRYEKTDAYLEEKLVRCDEVLSDTLRRSDELEIPPIAVSPLQGAMIQILAKSMGAKRILELGTLAGYSTIWLARALPEDGELVSLELHDRTAKLAEENLANAGLSAKTKVIRGPAENSLNVMINDGEAPFDLIFLDADKWNYPIYLEKIEHLSRPGTLIIADNVVRDGGIVDPENTDPAVRGVREFFDMIEANDRFTATACQTVGSKGHDGFALIYVN